MAHRVVALALPRGGRIDLATPAQVFGHRTEHGRYDFVVRAERPGAVSSSTSFAIGALAGLDALETADTVIVPGYLPPTAAASGARRPEGCRTRGARIASV